MSQVASYRSQATGHRLQATGLRSRILGYRSHVQFNNRGHEFIKSEFRSQRIFKRSLSMLYLDVPVLERFISFPSIPERIALPESLVKDFTFKLSP